MKFFFPDSQDQIDPTFDFATEERSTPAGPAARRPLRPRGAPCRVIDGLLVSKAIVDGHARRRREIHPGPAAPPLPGRSQAVLPPRLRPGPAVHDHGRLRRVQLRPRRRAPVHRRPGHRLLRRVRLRPRHLRRPRHPRLRPGRRPGPGHPQARDVGGPPATHPRPGRGVPRPSARAARCGFTPLGVAQGWSPASYAHAVRELQTIGYTRIARRRHGPPEDAGDPRLPPRRSITSAPRHPIAPARHHALQQHGRISLRSA